MPRTFATGRSYLGSLPPSPTHYPNTTHYNWQTASTNGTCLLNPPPPPLPPLTASGQEIIIHLDQPRDLPSWLSPPIPDLTNNDSTHHLTEIQCCWPQQVTIPADPVSQCLSTLFHLQLPPPLGYIHHLNPRPFQRPISLYYSYSTAAIVHYELYHHPQRWISFFYSEPYEDCYASIRLNASSS